MNNTEFKKLNKKARGLMLVAEILAAIIFTAIIGIAWFFLKDNELPISGTVVAIVIAVIWVISIIVPFVRYERYRYCFSDDKIDVKEGFLFVHRNIVPIERLHKIAMETGPLDRMFGLSKVKVTTAGGDVTIRFLETTVAEGIVEKLKNRINQYAAEARK